jgi:dihydroorotase
MPADSAFSILPSLTHAGLPRNTDKITLVRELMKIPESYQFGDSVVVPMWAGEELSWTVA